MTRPSKLPTCEKCKPCIECGSALHRLSDGTEAYPHRPDLASKHFWFCVCGAFVGCHDGTTKPLGAPAGKQTKRVRSDAHKKFDYIWRTGKMTRNEAYKWLAGRIGINASDCHIGNMDKTTALKVIATVQAYERGE